MMMQAVQSIDKAVYQPMYKQTPLYKFLEYCEQEKRVDDVQASTQFTILDCGAGGDMPPLGLFSSHGYRTTGIEFDEKQIKKAEHFASKIDQVLGIVKGDMTQLGFEDDSFDFVYSYNSVFHMKKDQIAQAISEMKRVLKPNGLLFVNFLSVDDFRCGEGPDLGNHQYEQMDDEPVIHSYFNYDEAETYLSDMAFVVKERRVIERIFEGERIKQGFIDYIMRKK